MESHIRRLKHVVYVLLSLRALLLRFSHKGIFTFFGICVFILNIYLFTTLDPGSRCCCCSFDGHMHTRAHKRWPARQRTLAV